MKFRNIGKKLLICGISLVMISSLGSGTVNAQHIHHSINSIRTSKVTKTKHSYNSSFKHFKHMYKYYINHVTYSMYKKCNKYFLKHISDFTSYQLNRICNSNIDTVMSRKNLKLILHKMHKIWTSTNNVNKLSNQDTNFDTQVRTQTIKDINNSRKQFGRKPLIVTNMMQQTANYRAPKVQYAYDHINEGAKVAKKVEHITPKQLQAQGGSTDGWIHGNDTHTTGSDYLGKQGYPDEYWGANAGPWIYSSNEIDANGIHYNNSTPQNVADNMNDSLMNHDMSYGNNNGHRKNELNPNYKYLGVGVSYNPQTNQGTINEQFAE